MVIKKLFQLAKLMANEFSEQVEDFDIIDCRYPYEFKGGHIKVR